MRQSLTLQVSVMMVEEGLQPAGKSVKLQRKLDWAMQITFDIESLMTSVTLTRVDTEPWLLTDWPWFEGYERTYKQQQSSFNAAKAEESVTLRIKLAIGAEKVEGKLTVQLTEQKEAEVAGGNTKGAPPATTAGTGIGDASEESTNCKAKAATRPDSCEVEPELGSVMEIVMEQLTERVPNSQAGVKYRLGGVAGLNGKVQVIALLV